MSMILVISPHPDDEAIGCGGTIRKHIEENDKVEVIFLTSGEKGGHGLSEEETKKVRESEAKTAAGILGVPSIEFWEYPDGSFQATETTIQRLIKKIKTIKADIIYVPHEDESHPDHRAAAQLVHKVVDSMDMKNTRVLMYEVWTPIQRIDHIVDISPFVKIKQAAILAYESQCAVLQFDEAILGLNRYRGEMHSWPGGEFAEIFKLLEK